MSITYADPGHASCIECQDVRPHTRHDRPRYCRESSQWLIREGVDCDICAGLSHVCYECADLVPDRVACSDNEGNRYCVACWGSYFLNCDRCGECTAKDDTYCLGEYSWCQSCVDWHAEWCETCGEYHDEDHEGRCNGIHDHSFTPHLTFFGEAPAFMGLELETEWVSHSGMADGVRELNSRFGDAVYCKHDGSLTNGFEIVSHPRSLESWQQFEALGSMLESLRLSGARSWNPETCGIHVHLSRDAFTGDAHITLGKVRRVRRSDAIPDVPEDVRPEGTHG